MAITALITMEWALERGRVSVPYVLGAAAPLAIERLKAHDLEGKIIGEKYHPSIPKGAVVHQDPPPGARVKAKRTVRLTISQGSNELFLPDFTFQPKDRVRRYMGAKGLALGD
ncbi:MAG: PASTA domain-containing protein, partial [candidate division NC10 bacterium]|nr:PASTA domain-containing protein [candidate division NC10 bacterium]